MKKFFLLPLFVTIIFAQQTDRWQLNETGGITWNIKPDETHADHIEMSGKKVSTVVRYKVNADGSFDMSRSVIWPMIRTIPNNTHASLTRRFAIDIPKMIIINGKAPFNEKVKSITLNGTMIVKSTFEPLVEITRIMFPSYNLPAWCEKYVVKNLSKKVCTVEIPSTNISYTTSADAGVEGSYFPTVTFSNSGVYKVEPDEEISFSVSFVGKKNGEDFKIDIEKELQARNDFLKILNGQLIFESPDKILNTAFAFAKIRGAESIYETKGGYMHGPGGEAYYAAIWANDQAEYIGPFFPYLGYDIGSEASFNAYKHFARFINTEYKPIPSSIIAEGIDIWNGAGDRGDAAMIAYGAARYALVRGDKKVAEELWNLIEWCLEFCKRKINKNGVVASDSDELEGRFPSGDANLCTSSLYYDALHSAVFLGRELHKPAKQLKEYSRQADELKENIDKHFGFTLSGFETYRYYEGNDKLRAWICIPLTVDIFDRKNGTIDALFSPQLWTDDGLATEEGDKTFWDRSTLYALRGVLNAGETERAMNFLKYYSQRRLLGDHVPYPVEAYPEGSQRHLSAESGLYCRIFAEGLFGIRPIGLKSFKLTPHLPKDWDFMNLKNAFGFGNKYNIEVKRINDRIEIVVSSNDKIIVHKKIKDGESVIVEF